MKETKTENYNYWVNRSKNDKRLDWRIGESSWIEGYVKSIIHPHRELIIQALKSFEWSYLLEIGCNVGPNLFLIRQNFPEKALFGIDANEECIKKAKEFLDKNIELRTGNFEKLSYPDKYFDVVLSDAVLMYTSDKEIDKTIKELDRITKSGFIFIEWDSRTIKGEVKSFHWARNYKRILEKLGCEVERVKLTPEQWPTSQSWIKNGYIYIAQRA